MTIVSLRLSILEEDVLHFLGYPEGRRPSGRLAPLLDEVLLAARSLAEGRGAFRELPVSAAAGLGLETERADALVVGLVTAGGGIERRVTQLLAEGDATRALLLDAAGSAAAEEAARRLGALAVEGGAAGAAALGAAAVETGAVGAGALGSAGGPCRISPGYGRWPLSAQEALFALLPHEELGITLGSSMMMIPRKSVSFALWIGLQGAPRSGLSACDCFAGPADGADGADRADHTDLAGCTGCTGCSLPTCRYRRGAAAPPQPSPSSSPPSRMADR